MSMVRVYNENKYPYRENFKGETIEIEAGGYIKMDEKKAILFMGTYAQAKKTPQGEPDPLYFKKLKIVKEADAPKEAEAEKFVCQFDGKEFETKEALEKYINENHLDKLTDQKFAEERRKGKK